MQMTNPLHPRFPAAALICATLAFVTACGSPTPAAAPAGAAPAATAVPATAAVVGPAAASAATTVRMTEYTFSLDPGTLTAGPHVFHAVNVGTYPHAIQLDGVGVEDQKTAIVPPGGSADLAVTLHAGDLDMYCPVGNHREKGMEVHLHVTAAAASGSGGGVRGY